jgi:predicted DCC family thiol-disulfide oxidoreductase YuxK
MSIDTASDESAESGRGQNGAAATAPGRTASAPNDPPSLAAGDSGPVIVFDGVCVLCNGWIGFLLRHDRDRRYRFAAMQGTHGRGLLAEHGLDPDDPVSFLLVEDGRAWTDTDAIARVLVGLGGIWRLGASIRWLPRVLRDPLYRLIARNRYRWFGRYERCLLPTPEQRARFLD